MTRAEMEIKITELNEWESLIKEATEAAETIKDALKAEMIERETEELDTGSHIIRYVNVLSNRFDSTAFKKVYAELYKTYTKQTASKRFTISA